MTIGQTVEGALYLGEKPVCYRFGDPIKSRPLPSPDRVAVLACARLSFVSPTVVDVDPTIYARPDLEEEATEAAIRAHYQIVDPHQGEAVNPHVSDLRNRVLREHYPDEIVTGIAVFEGDKGYESGLIFPSDLPNRISSTAINAVYDLGHLPASSHSPSLSSMVHGLELNGYSNPSAVRRIAGAITALCVPVARELRSHLEGASVAGPAELAVVHELRVAA